MCRGGVSPPDNKGENLCLQGETKPFRGDEHPLERLFTNFLSEATESYKERLWRTGQRRGSHALRAYLNSVPTLSYPRQPASSAWTTASMLIGGFSPPKLVKSRVKRGSGGVFISPPPKIIMGVKKDFRVCKCYPKILLPKSSWGFGREKYYLIWEFATQSVQTQCATR